MSNVISYRQCGRCCRGNPQSVCMAHGMGALVADEMVEKAFVFQPLELDLRYSSSYALSHCWVSTVDTVVSGGAATSS